MSDLKKFISNVILAGAVGALAAFGVSLAMTKKWQVSGKVVVFPSGKPVSASQNLAEEIGNTAWIINGDTFQERNFGDLAGDFAGAEVLKNSSIVLAKFRSSEENIQAVEELIVKIPSQVDEYARDLYDGSPFKYKMVSDPEISASPARPNVVANSTWGAMIGAALYLFYWLFIESFILGKTPEKKKDIAPVFVSPEIPRIPEEPPAAELISDELISEEMPEPMPEIYPEKETRKITPISKTSSAPENLPVAGPELPSAPTTSEEYREPSDEEVKERLNKLMRGEL